MKALRRVLFVATLAVVAVAPAFALTQRPRSRGSAARAPILSALPVWQEEATLLPTGDAIGDLNDGYATSVAADGDTVAIGVPGHQATNADGCVRVYLRSAGTWTEQAFLTAPSPDAVAFGSQVALSGDTLAVATGSYGAGGVYVYVRSGAAWSLQSTIAATPDAWSFGAALALSGDTLAVGAPDANTGFGFDSGAAFVYVRVAGAWTLEQEVLGFEVASQDRFGRAIALEGDALAVGAPGDSTGVAVGAGSVYLFARAGGNWAQTLKLFDPTAAPSAEFGAAVALAGTTLAVGAPAEASVEGRVHVYENVSGTWIQRALAVPASPEASHFGGSLAIGPGQLLVGFTGLGPGLAELLVDSGGVWISGAVLTAPSLDPSIQFAKAVALAGSTAVVGAPGWLGTGAAWVFTGSGSAWTVQATLDNPGSARGDAFATATALDGQTLVVGAPKDDTVAGRQSGAVYVFEHTVTGWVLRQKLVPSAELVAASPPSPEFGSSVAVSGDRLVVGAPAARFGGRVLSFARAAGVWTLVAELAPTGPQVFPRFGAATALRGSRLLVGAPQADTVSSEGALYAFEETAGQWSLQQQLALPSNPPYGLLGTAVAIAPAGTRAVVGAPGVESAGILTLVGGLWTVDRVVSKSQPSLMRSFGEAVAASDTLSFVGEPQARGAHSESGAVEIFDATGGLRQRLQVDDAGLTQRFGSALAVDASTLVVGAPGSTTPAGVVHVFQSVAGSWTRAVALETPPASGLGSLFGASVAASAGRVAVGQPGAQIAGPGGGAAHVFAPSVSDVGIALSAPATATQGSLVTIGVSLTNSGPDTIAGASFRLTLDPGLVPPDGPADAGTSTYCSTAAAVIACSVPSLAVGTTLVAEFVRVAVAVGNSSVLGEVLSSDANPVNDSATVGIDVAASTADVNLVVSGPQFAEVGRTAAYGLLVSNAGPGAAAGLKLDFATPPGLVRTGVSGCTADDCRIARLDVGASATVWASYSVPENYSGPAPVVFSASVTTQTQDPALADNSDSYSSPFVLPPTPLDYYTVAPCRLFDSRASGPILAGGTPRILSPQWTACGIPWTARALALNVTVTGGTTAGNVRLYPAHSPVPPTSTVNFVAGQTRAGNAVVGLSPGGALAVFVAPDAASVHVILDVAGYFQ